jgi:hypothetical protein
MSHLRFEQFASISLYADPDAAFSVKAYPDPGRTFK